jgi:hypothetical protein
MSAILLQLLLDRGKQRGVDQGREGDGDPLGGWDSIVCSGAARLLRAAPLGP